MNPSIIMWSMPYCVAPGLTEGETNRAKCLKESRTHRVKIVSKSL